MSILMSIGVLVIILLPIFCIIRKDYRGGKLSQDAGTRTPMDAFIIGLTLLTLLIIIVNLAGRYPAASDAAAIIGVVLPSITTLAAAAFGIVQSAKAGAAEKDANAKKDILNKVNMRLLGVDDDLDTLEHAARTAIPSVSGSNKYELNLRSFVEEHSGKQGDLSVTKIDFNKLTEARQKLAQIKGMIEANT